MTNQVLKNMIRQLRMQGVNLSNKQLLSEGSNTLQIQQKPKGRKKKKGAKIKYNRGSDLYDVEAFEVNLDSGSKDFGKTKKKKYTNVYSDKLKELINF